MSRFPALWLSLLLTAVILPSCSILFPLGDPVKLPEITILKQESLQLMSKAHEPFDAYRVQVTKLKAQLDDVLARETAAKRHATTLPLWRKLTDPKGGLLGGFLADWEKRGRVSSAFIAPKQDEVGAAFDKIASVAKQPSNP